MTTKKKIIKEEEDGYNFCGEDNISEGYTKNIPTIKAGISVVEFAVKEVSLKSVSAIKNCLEFYSETKHASLPSKEGSGMSDEEKDALKRHTST